MSDPSVDTALLHNWLERMRAGDQTARDEMLRSLCGRLERLARKMIQRFPDVHRFAQTDDVLQNSLMRLLRALQEVQPTSMRDFFGLAAEQMRRELLDLARHFHGREGVEANLARQGPSDDTRPPAPDPPAPAEDPDDLEKWSTFHLEVAKLPVEEREVVGLLYYHGWTQAEVAELFGIHVRTVRRRWEAALVKLHRVLRAEGPAA